MDRRPPWTESSLGRRPLGRRPSLDRIPSLDRRPSEQEAHLDRRPPGQQILSGQEAVSGQEASLDMRLLWTGGPLGRRYSLDGSHSL